MLRRHVLSLCFTLGFAAVPTAFATDKVSADAFAAAAERGEVAVIVIFGTPDPIVPEAGLSAEDRSTQRAAIAETGQAVLDSLPKTPQYAKRMVTQPMLAIPADSSTLQALEENPFVKEVRVDGLSAPDGAGTDDPVVDGTTLASSVPVIGADVAQAYGIRGTGITVAILDTGIQKTHPFLSGKVVSEACYSTTNSVYSSTTLCPGGVESSTATGSGVNCSLTIDSGCAHGTHVAGIAAGEGGGSTGVTFSGVAPEAKVIAIQVFSRFDSTYYCGGASTCVLSYDSDQILALERVYELRSSYNVAAANMSLGGGRYYTYCDSDSRKPIVDSLRSSGIATVISSGNDYYRDSVGAPGCISSAATVGATDDSDNVASFSNIDDTVDFLAPGVTVTSSVPTLSGSGYATWNGTSMSAPHVTGVFALFSQLDPLASVDEKQSRLASLAVQVDDNRTGGVQTDIDRVAVSWMGNGRCMVTGKVANRWSYTSSTPYSYVSISPEADYGTGYAYYARVPNGTSIATLADVAKRRVGNLGHKPTVTIRGTGPCPTSGTLRYIYSADYGYLSNER